MVVENLHAYCKGEVHGNELYGGLNRNQEPSPDVPNA